MDYLAGGRSKEEGTAKGGRKDGEAQQETREKQGKCRVHEISVYNQNVSEIFLL